MDKKIVLVTGANRGIGYEISKQFAWIGYKVIMTGRNELQLKESAKQLVDEGCDVEFKAMDVRKHLPIRYLGQYIDREYGRLDVIINNAGVMLDPEMVGLNTSPKEIKETMETNTFGPLRVCKELVPIMVKNNQGIIINVSSAYGAISGNGVDSPAYRISKSSLNMLTRILSDELVNTNIKVNAVCPGWVRTDMGGQNAPTLPEDAAASIVWMATSQELVLSGKFYQNRKVIAW